MEALIRHACRVSRPGSSCSTISIALCVASCLARRVSGKLRSWIRSSFTSRDWGCDGWTRACMRCWAAMRQSLDCWSALIDGVAADPTGIIRQLSWHDGFNCGCRWTRRPRNSSAVGADRERMRGGGSSAAGDSGRLVFPAEFNEFAGTFDNKGAAFSHVTIGLLRD